MFSDVELLKIYLDELKALVRKLYLAGDIFDAWRIDCADSFAPLFNDFNEIIYIEGNHDLHFSVDNPIGVKAQISKLINIGTKKGIVTHGHYFDSKINRGNLLGRLIDKLIYSISKRIGWNLRDLTLFMRKRYSLKLELEIVEKAKLFNKDFIIIGHTHEGGPAILENTRVFNLGSWLSMPWAFYLTGDDKYAICKIERKNLFPEGKDFHNIW